MMYQDTKEIHGIGASEIEQEDGSQSKDMLRGSAEGTYTEMDKDTENSRSGG